jgi:hypothetical protein
MTHVAPREAVRATLHELAEMADVLPGTRVIRVLEE